MLLYYRRKSVRRFVELPFQYNFIPSKHRLENDLKAQTRSVFRRRGFPFLYFLSGFLRSNISNKRSKTVRGGVSEFGSTCSGGFHVLHETCGTHLYFLCQAMLLLRD